MNVPAEHVLHLPGVAPVSWIAVLEPEDMRREIGGNVLAVRHARHLAVLSQKILTAS